MLTRTFLARFISARTGLVASAFLALAPLLRAQPPVPVPEGPTILLAPLLVEETKIKLTWRYFSMPGREVLAACDDRTAADIVERVRLLDNLMEAILPERFLIGPKALETLILVDEKTGTQAMADIVRQNGTQARFMPNLRLMDQGSVAIFALVTQASAAKFGYTEERVMTLMERRVPRLPDWFIEGVRGFYGQMTFGDQDIEVGPATWLSRRESAALRTEPDRPRVLWPMEEFFARRESDDDGGPQNEWRAQAALFIRWALLENNGASKEALWKFVDRLEQEPPSEALFREHFGIGYADMRDELSDYLWSAPRQQTKILAPRKAGPSPARAKFRPATELEIARIRGEWERMEISYARAHSPALLDRYITQARKTFRRVYDAGERDPRLLASMGLMELDAGNPDAARPLLEAAVAAKVVRPNAYFELARLRYGAIDKEIGRAEKLNPAQVADVLGPLFEGQRQDPPMLENYVLMTEVAGRSDAPPTAAQLAAMHEGASKFPRVSALVARVIAFHVANGQLNAANALAEIGRRYARPSTTPPVAAIPSAPILTSAAVEARFQQLHSLAREGEPAEALREMRWCLEEGLPRVKPEVAKVRMRAVIMALGELAKRYPPAYEPLREQRDDLFRQVVGDGSKMSLPQIRPGTDVRQKQMENSDGIELVTDYVNLLNALPTPDGVQGVADLLAKLPKGDLRRSMLLNTAKDLLVEGKRYDLAMDGTDARQLFANSESMLGIRGVPQMRQVIRNIEILAGVGQVGRARELALKVLAADRSVETGVLIQQRLERAGQPDLLSVTKR